MQKSNKHNGADKMAKTKEQIREEMKKLALEYADLDKQEKLNSEKKYIPASGKNLGAEELVNMIDASLDMWLTAGHFNAEFEKKFAEKLSARYAMTCNSGSSANLLAMSALTSPILGKDALCKGDEVISVAAGFPTTVTPIIQNGLVPVFIDSEIGTYNIKIEDIEPALSPKTRAIFLAHTLGNMYDMDAIMDIAKRHNLFVIEDSCDALGAKWQDKYAGTIGHIGTFSFYPAHHITMGEGGAVITDNPKIRKAILSFRDWGRDCYCNPGTDNTCHNRFNLQCGALPGGYDHKYVYSHVGYNLKITDWQASIGLAQLGKLDSFLEMRRNNAAVLNQELSGLQDYLILPHVANKCIPSWFGYLISVKPDAPFTKQEMVPYLEQNGIGTRNLFAGNILRQPVLKNNDVPMRIGNGKLQNSRDLTERDYTKLPGADFIMNNTFWVGVAQNNTPKDMLKTAKVIHDFVKQHTR